MIPPAPHYQPESERVEAAVVKTLQLVEWSLPVELSPETIARAAINYYQAEPAPVHREEGKGT